LQLRTDHLFREQRTYGMRNRIMHMEQIQIVHFRNLRKLARERKIVRRIAEYIIIAYFHFMIINVFMKFPQTKRHAVRNKMDLMAFLRPQLAELRRNNARSAKRRITRNSDFQRFSHNQSLLFLPPVPVANEEIT